MNWAVECYYLLYIDLRYMWGFNSHMAKPHANPSTVRKILPHAPTLSKIRCTHERYGHQCL